MKVMIPSEEWKNQVGSMKELKKGYSSGDASTKKIYYHPIFFANTSSETYNFMITCAILNNNATPFTYETFKAYIKKLMNDGALIQCNGYITDINDSNKMYTAVLINWNNAQQKYLITMFRSSGSTTIELDTLNVIGFADGVNAIN